jgi:hypothetical protein
MRTMKKCIKKQFIFLHGALHIIIYLRKKPRHKQIKLHNQQYQVNYLKKNYHNGQILLTVSDRRQT